jgi:MazG family protein
MSQAVQRLREIIARLRAPGGCPWDREQTADSLRTSLLEEAYEVVDAIERAHAADLEEELGDLMINIMMQAQIASEQEAFTLDTIAATASEKLVRRHPHVFGDATAVSSGQVLERWEEIKRAEMAAKTKVTEATDSPTLSLLDGVARAFPALVRAQKIQKKAAKAGFDWECPEDVLDKIREELGEVEEEMALRDKAGHMERLAGEIGDLLFAVVNLSRSLGIDAESSLQGATGKFSRRFRSMERATPVGSNFASLTFSEMNALWEMSKQAEKTKGIPS